jgi:hypothetical protein
MQYTRRALACVVLFRQGIQCSCKVCILKVCLTMWLFMNLWHMLDPSLLNIRRTKSFNVVFPSVNDESTHVQFKGANASEKRLAAMAAFGWTAEECLVERPGEQERVELAVLLNSENGAVKRQATTLLTSLRNKICNRETRCVQH